MPMSQPNPTADPEDVFRDTRMSFGDHIEELRSHLLRAIYGFVVGMVVALIFAKWVFAIITHPVEEQLMVFYNHRVEKVAKELEEGNRQFEDLNKPKEVPYYLTQADAQKLGLRVDQMDTDGDFVKFPLWTRPLSLNIILAEAQRQVGRPPMLSTMNVMEAFMVYFKIVAVTGLVISSPWVFYQLWSFVAAGLYPHEKKYVHQYLPMSVGLFIAGVVLCQVMVIPNAIRSLLWFNQWLDLEPDLRLNEWLTFAILLPLVFGISFQTPLVMLFLGKLGIMDAAAFRKKRFIAWFILCVFAAMVTPSDALSMLMLMIPMWGLYELGILMVKYSAPPPEEVPDPSDELIEV
jgi:sec-independent protein translocase protein TatC